MFSPNPAQIATPDMSTYGGQWAASSLYESRRVEEDEGDLWKEAVRGFMAPRPARRLLLLSLQTRLKESSEYIDPHRMATWFEGTFEGPQDEMFEYLPISDSWESSESVPSCIAPYDTYPCGVEVTEVKYPLHDGSESQEPAEVTLDIESTFLTQPFTGNIEAIYADFKAESQRLHSQTVDMEASVSRRKGHGKRSRSEMGDNDEEYRPERCRKRRIVKACASTSGEGDDGGYKWVTGKSKSGTALSTDMNSLLRDLEELLPHTKTDKVTYWIGNRPSHHYRCYAAVAFNGTLWTDTTPCMATEFAGVDSYRRHIKEQHLGLQRR